MQRRLSELSVKTAALNGFGNFEAVNCKIQRYPRRIGRNFPSCCATRPTSGAGLKTTIIKKRSAARRSQSISRRLPRAAAFALRFGGRLALVNRADRLAEVCYTLREAGIEVKRVQFVAGKAGAAPYLLMAEGCKGRPTAYGAFADAYQ